MADEAGTTRRDMVTGGGLGLAALAMSAASASATGSAGQPTPIDEGAVQGADVSFPPIHAETERPDAPPPNPDPPSHRVGFAVVGLGRLAVENILPAFAECKHARPVALVSGDPAKMAALAAQYGIAPQACYDYSSFERIRDNPAVEAVYVVTPNALHRDGVVAAARAGKHVLCEKAHGRQRRPGARDGRSLPHRRPQADDRLPLPVREDQRRAGEARARRRVRPRPADRRRQHPEPGRPHPVAPGEAPLRRRLPAGRRALLPEHHPRDPGRGAG